MDTWPRFLIAPPLRAEHRRLLLCLADEQHAFLCWKLAPEFGGYVVFALPLLEPDHRDFSLFGELFHLRNEGLADRVHQRAGRKLETAMETEETGHSCFPLQGRYVHVQISLLYTRTGINQNHIKLFY